MKIYYAHCMLIYNTPQELRDIEFLAKAGFEVFNPNQQIIQDEVINIKNCTTCAKREDWMLHQYKDEYGYLSSITNKRYGQQDCMNFFGDLIKTCDAFAFRPLPNGQIPSGVAFELEVALKKGLPIIELPSDYIKKDYEKRTLNHGETIVWLSELGQR